jgi:hypothetical protein
MFSRRLLILFLAPALITAMGCESNNPSPILTAIELASQTIVGGTPAPATARISAAAPASGFPITLSSNSAIVTVPASVTVPSGATSVPFTITSNAVAANTPVTITGVGGATVTSNLTIAPPALTAVFTVLRNNNTVPNECRLQAGGGQFDCVFNASGSVGPNLEFQWFYTISPNSPGVNEQTVQFNPSNTLNPVLTGGCGFFTGRTGGGAATPLQMLVRLTVRAPGGATATSTNMNVSVIPLANTCGF